MYQGISGAPPYSNTGAQNTDANTLRACVDWVQGTFQKISSHDEVIEILQLEKNQFVEMETGMLGYKRQLRFGNIVILSEGRENMGVHLIMSGQGCREYEELRPGNWFNLFRDILRLGKFTRIDLAIDDFAGYFTVRKLSRKLKEGLCRSKFKSAKRIENIIIEDGQTKGETLYFGSGSSRIKIRFYDKLQERIAAGKEIEKDIKHWVRSEIQARDERANILATFILAGEPIGDIAAGILKNYVAFLDRGSCSNKARWPFAKWWDKFLGDVEKIRLTEVAPDRTVEKARAWIDHQVRKTLGMLFLAYDSDLHWLIDVLNSGMDDLTEKEMKIIERYKEALKNKSLLLENEQQARPV